MKGLVQGVGFRPFILRLARSFGLCGYVDNRINGVCIRAEGPEEIIMHFRDEILRQAPQASIIKDIIIKEIPVKGYREFEIAPSNPEGNLITEISPDIAVCSECLADMESDPARIDYPLVNCTNCGPRFTIIENLPYDRASTSMKVFGMCSKCSMEYNDVTDRRFHAQPVACNNCGPLYTLESGGKTITGIVDILRSLCSIIDNGGSVALKGQGGYHLLCDALNPDAVRQLRERKHRDHKPFAVMFRDMEAVEVYCHVTANEKKELISWRRPVVILEQKNHMPEEINSRLGTIGAVLPYMPVHFLIFRELRTPALVFTSGNISEEPVIKDDDIARKILIPVAGNIVTYNREIVNRADDSVLREIAGIPRFIRRARGYVPSPVDLTFSAEGIFAAGAELKNCFCIGKGHQAIMSQHIGDLKNMMAYDFFRESAGRFRNLFLFEPALVSCDLHPDYLSTHYAEHLSETEKIPLIKVQHHHAHITSCMAEYNLTGKVIGISFDGTGYGPDGNIWGGEFLVADENGYRRYSHFDYVPMPGGDKAAINPWRMAFSYLYKCRGKKFNPSGMKAFNGISLREMDTVAEMIDKNINSPPTSAAGRLFDAVSSLLGLCSAAAFDSEAPMRLEAAAAKNIKDHYPFVISDIVDFTPAIDAITDDISSKDISYISAMFHNTLAYASLHVAGRIREEEGINRVVLSGGVFQNKYLLEKLTELLSAEDFEVFSNRLVPANDGGIALGQLYVASQKRNICA